MENEKKPTLRLGAFVALGLAVLLVGMALIGRKRNLFSDTFTVHAMFHNVGGLQVGNHVQYAGVKVGSVKEMTFQDAKTIRVTVVVDKKIQKFLTTSAVGSVSSEGLIGNKILVIDEPGAGGTPLKDQDSIQGYPPPNFDDLFKQVKGSMDDFRLITSDVAAILQKVRAGEGTLGKILMDPRFARTVDHTLINLQEGSKDLKENMDAAKHSWLLWGSGKGKAKEKAKEKKDSVPVPSK